MKLPDFSVNDRVAILTGAGRGIGLGIAQGLAAAGAAVAIQDIELSVAESAAEEINRAGGRAIALGGDATDVRLADELVAQTVESLGHLHILINNASVQRVDKFLETPIEEMVRQLNCNVLFATRMCQLSIPHMQRAEWGRVINIGSIQGRGGNPDMPAYSMSKAAIANLTLGLARKYGREGITVNCISPGWYITLRNADQFPPGTDPNERAKGIPIPRLGTNEDCAGVAVLLCSRAGEYITGQNIYVDGGMSAR